MAIRVLDSAPASGFIVKNTFINVVGEPPSPGHGRRSSLPWLFKPDPVDTVASDSSTIGDACEWSPTDSDSSLWCPLPGDEDFGERDFGGKANDSTRNIPYHEGCHGTILDRDGCFTFHKVAVVKLDGKVQQVTQCPMRAKQRKSIANESGVILPQGAAAKRSHRRSACTRNARPNKTERDMYKRLAMRLECKAEANPELALDELHLPPSIARNAALVQKLTRRVDAAKAKGTAAIQQGVHDEL